MDEEIVLLADELALLRWIAAEARELHVTVDVILWPIAEVLLLEQLLAHQDGRLCVTEIGDRFLCLTGEVGDGEAAALDRRLLQAA